MTTSRILPSYWGILLCWCQLWVKDLPWNWGLKNGGGQDETGGEHCQGSGGFFSRPYRKMQKKSRRAYRIPHACNKNIDDARGRIDYLANIPILYANHRHSNVETPARKRVVAFSATSAKASAYSDPPWKAWHEPPQDISWGNEIRPGNLFKNITNLMIFLKNIIHYMIHPSNNWGGNKWQQREISMV